MRRLALVGAVLLEGCLAVPHSAILGQTAAPLARGEVAGASSIGLGYQQVGHDQTTNGTLQLPAIEGNLAVGITDRVGFNLHGSEVGLLPGVKATLVHGPFDLAVMPEIGGGYFYGHQSTSTPLSNVNSSSNSGDLLVGLRVLFSISVVYAAVGYDFLAQWTSSNDNAGNPLTKTSSQYHTLAFNLGLDLAAGAVQVRPEVAFLVSPAGETTDETRNPQQRTEIGYEWTILPSITVWVAKAPK